MEIPLDMNDTASIKKTLKRGRALPRRVSRVRAKVIKRTVKDRIEFASKNSRYQWVDQKGWRSSKNWSCAGLQLGP